MEIAVISGKGGTGKTTISAAFAALAGNIVISDCDVDAPDLHILLQPEIQRKEQFYSSKVATLDFLACTECGICVDNCRFDAVHPPQVDSIACEGCGVCAYVCPEKAIEMTDRLSGFLYESKTRFGPMAHAKLLPGEGNSGKLVTEVRKLGASLAKSYKKDIILIDGSPGIGCPVIATVTNIKLGIVVTEPTMSGIHDMGRVVDLLNRFNIQPSAIVNKYDLNIANTKYIEQFCLENNIELLGKIPFESLMTKSMVAAKTFPEFAPESKLTYALGSIWNKVSAIVSN